MHWLKFLTILSIILSASFALDISASKLHVISNKGLDLYEGALGDDFHINLENEEESTIQLTFYAKEHEEFIKPERVTIALVDESSGHYWEDVVGVRERDGRCRYNLHTSNVPLQSLENRNINIQLYISSNDSHIVKSLGNVILPPRFVKIDDNEYGIRDEINHLFRSEPPRTSTIISFIGSITNSISPLLLFLAITSTQLSISLKFTKANINFLITLTLFESLLLTYWYKLTLFQLLPLALISSIGVFVTGRQSLSQIQRNRLKHNN